MGAGALRRAAAMLRAHGDPRMPDGSRATTDALATDAARAAYMEAGQNPVFEALAACGALELEDGEGVVDASWAEAYDALASLMEALADAEGGEGE